jgi:hypothetical protein
MTKQLTKASGNILNTTDLPEATDQPELGTAGSNRALKHIGNQRASVYFKHMPVYFRKNSNFPIIPSAISLSIVFWKHPVHIS